MHNIKNDIKIGIYSNIYIFSGEEDFLIDFYTKEIISKVTDPDTKEFNLLKIYNNLPQDSEIDSFVNSYPFMSEKKVLIIEDTKIFKKTPDSVKTFFSELVSNIPEYMIIIFAEKEIDKRNALYKQISKIYPVCEFEFQSIQALSTWITKFFNSNGKEIARDDASYICEIAGPSMLCLKAEAEKLISFTEGETITREIIVSLVTRNIENRVFAMIDDIVSSDNINAMKKLSDLKALNEEPIKIISIIFNKFAAFHKLLTLKNKSIREICSICGMYEKHAKNNLAQAQVLGAKKIANVMLKCRDMDFAIKNGTIDKWVAVELVLFETLS